MWRETSTDSATVQRLWGPRGRKAAARAGQRMQPGPCARHGGGRADAGDLAAVRARGRSSQRSWREASPRSGRACERFGISQKMSVFWRPKAAAPHLVPLMLRMTPQIDRQNLGNVLRQ